jgi:uncharacterized protein (TIGR01319 family)
VGLDRLAADLRTDFPAHAVAPVKLEEYVQRITNVTETVPDEEWHMAADAVLARTAVDLAIARHVGRRERIVAREGEAWVHSGKDLRDTHMLIGTGGVFIHNRFAGYILSPGKSSDDRVQVLRPRNPNKHLDASYLLYAVGLLSERYPDVALRMFKRYVTPAG